MLLDMRQITKRFGNITILDDVSLSLSAGEVIALTGESGSGKSTFLHIAAGLEPLDEGSVTINGTEIHQLNDGELANLRRTSFGIIFQQFNLIPSLTVAKNLTFQARLNGLTTDVDELADRLGLTDQLAKYPEDLSGGEQQRVAIGRAAAAQSKLILADEPTGNLDENTGDAVFELLLSLARDTGAGLLIVTHSSRLAARADRRLHLTHGRFQS
ncbi:MAG: ATP-binding cassette domain-containing protein [Boseongicola sp.]|nr:MAG: ATP-binding cassette domain-containing protein [Boseongicola sp.]